MIDPDVLGGSYELGKQAIQCGNEFAWDLGAKGSVSRKSYHGGALGRSCYPKTMMMWRSSLLLGSLTRQTVNGGSVDNSQCRIWENTTHVSFGALDELHRQGTCLSCLARRRLRRVWPQP